MIIKSVEFFKSAVTKKDYPTLRLPEVAFAGKSNVGKSSLINTILDKKGLARTSRTPGRTQLINYFIVNENSFFVDIPGYGFAKVSKEKHKGWGEMMEAYLRDSETLKGVVLIMDIRRLVQEDDMVLVEFLDSLNIPIIYVFTKTDKLSNNEIFRQKAALKKDLGKYYDEDKFILFSAVTKKGKDEVLKKIGECLAGKRLN